MAQLENIFSWSKSRDEEFKECRRKYYYSRYLSWGGWDAKAPPEIRLAYILKNLKNRWAWKGEVVHHVIEEVMKSLRAGHAVKKEDALARLTDRMRQDYRASKAGQYRQNPKKALGLFEHEYQKDIGDPVWKKIHDEAAACIAHFFDSFLYQEFLREDKAGWLVIEDLEEFEFQSPDLPPPGAKIYVKLDFARQKDGVVEIYDWKTGKESDEAAVQIGAYAIYAMQKWKKPLSEIRAFLFNISAGPGIPKRVPINEALIQEAGQTISQSVLAMRQLMANPVKNTPREREAFALTLDEKVCASCSFFKLCPRGANANSVKSY